MTLTQTLAEIRSRAERPTKQTKDDVLLLLDMVEKLIKQRNGVTENYCKSLGFSTYETENQIYSLDYKLLEMAKGKGE